jgi:hypothetical protein
VGARGRSPESDLLFTTRGGLPAAPTAISRGRGLIVGNGSADADLFPAGAAEF